MKIQNLRFRQSQPETEPVKKKERRKFPLVRCAIYILLSTLIATGFSMSRYSTTSPDGVDNARVAGFKVLVEAEAIATETSLGRQASFNDLSLVATGGNQSYKFTMKNESEVAVAARLIISHTTKACVFTNPAECLKIEDPAWESGKWVYFQSNDPKTEEFIVTVNGHKDGHVVNMKVEYEHVD